MTSIAPAPLEKVKVDRLVAAVRDDLLLSDRFDSTPSGRAALRSVLSMIIGGTPEAGRIENGHELAMSGAEFDRLMRRLRTFAGEQADSDLERRFSVYADPVRSRVVLVRPAAALRATRGPRCGTVGG